MWHLLQLQWGKQNKTKKNELKLWVILSLHYLWHASFSWNMIALGERSNSSLLWAMIGHRQDWCFEQPGAAKCPGVFTLALHSLHHQVVVPGLPASSTIIMTHGLWCTTHASFALQLCSSWPAPDFFCGLSWYPTAASCCQQKKANRLQHAKTAWANGGCLPRQNFLVQVATDMPVPALAIGPFKAKPEMEQGIHNQLITLWFPIFASKCRLWCPIRWRTHGSFCDDAAGINSAVLPFHVGFTGLEGTQLGSPQSGKIGRRLWIPHPSTLLVKRLRCIYSSKGGLLPSSTSGPRTESGSAKKGNVRPNKRRCLERKGAII